MRLIYISKITIGKLQVLYCERRQTAKKIFTNCFTQISFNLKYLILQNHLQLKNFHVFPNAIIHSSQRLCKLEYIYSSFAYSLSDDAVHCIDCTMLLSTEKQRSSGSFVNKV